MRKDFEAFAKRHGLSTEASEELRALLEQALPETEPTTMRDEPTRFDALGKTLVSLPPQNLDTLPQATVITAEPLERAETWSPGPSVEARLVGGRLESMFGEGVTGLGEAVSLHGGDSYNETRRAAGPGEGRSLDIGGENARYEDLGLLGVGGMGEVRRVRDRDLNRVLAMKIIKPRLLARPGALARFVEEAQVGAQLQHPGVLPVHEIGWLSDGRCYFTMQEVRGQTLADVIEAFHDTTPDASEWTLRRLIEIFRRVCEAVGYVHVRGVIHRDLKPANVMVGKTGEVLVVDWGLAKVLGRAERGVVDERPIESQRDPDLATLDGAVTGTPTYMPPEQALGQVERLDARSDVYALGAILYQILCGAPPYRGLDTRSQLMQLVMGKPPKPVEIVALRPLPEDLVEACRHAMQSEQTDRHSDASALAAEIAAWLDGAKRRDRALELVEEAIALEAETRALLDRAGAARETGAAQLAGVPMWAPEAAKRAGWALEDEAEALRLEATLTQLRAEQRFHASLSHAPELVEAHETLCARHEAEHRAAESRRDAQACTRARSLLETHAAALPEDHPLRAQIRRYLVGDGALTLHTRPAGARVTLRRYQREGRRLVLAAPEALGETPLNARPLAMGSYLLTIEREGHAPIRYPVAIDRCQSWRGIRPGDAASTPIVLPTPDAIARDEVYIPPGYFWAGGDPLAAESFPATRCWVDGFVSRRFPVTNREYLEFLNDLVARGRERDALRFAPRERAWAAGEDDVTVIYARDAAGRFCLQPDADGDMWDPDWPVVMVDWDGARAFSDWLAASTGQSWRLPTELEWEKAARGVDRRRYPWGDFLDPSWCCMRFSHKTRPLPAKVDSYPIDESPFGVRGVAGNVRQWCLDAYREGAPETLTDLDAILSTLDVEASRIIRGGSWDFDAQFGRPAQRNHNPPRTRNGGLGFRVVRSLS